MKNKIKVFKKLIPQLAFLSLLLSIGITFIASCTSDQKPQDTEAIAEEHNDAKFDNAKERDAQFLVAAAEINLEEIKLGQLAQTNSSTTNVKELGRMMETEHSKSLKTLDSLATKKQITVPASLTANGQQAYNKLMNKSGVEFDKEYCAMMVNGHKDAVKKFEKASTDSADPEIRAWATSMLPALRKHLDMSITCQKECEKM